MIYRWMLIPLGLSVLLFSWACYTRVQDQGVPLARALRRLAAQVLAVFAVLSLLWAAQDKNRRDERKAQACLDEGGVPVFVARGWEFHCLRKEVGR